MGCAPIASHLLALAFHRKTRTYAVCVDGYELALVPAATTLPSALSATDCPN